MSFAPLSIRLLCDQAARFNIIDINTGAAPVFVRGDNVNFEIGIGMDGVLQTSLGNVASVTLQLFESENDTNAPLLSQTILAANMNLGLTAPQWTGDTTPFNHAKFAFTPAQTAIDLDGSATGNFWLRIFVTTTDNPAQIAAIQEGPLQIRDGPVSAVAPPTPAALRFYTINGVQYAQVYDPASQLYYNIEIDTVQGIRSFSPGDVGYA
jgi:hypothetical protein